MVKGKKTAVKKASKDGWHYFSLPIGFFQARRAINELDKFSSLVRHLYNYGADTHRLKALDKLIDDFDSSPEWRYTQIKTAINKMIPGMRNRLVRLDAPVVYEFSNSEGETVKYDVLLDLFIQKPMVEDQMRHDLLLETLERASGAYESVRDRLLRRCWVPTTWVVWFLNMPVRILASAGVNPENEKTSTLYFYLLQALMAIVLILLAIRLGILPYLTNAATKLF